MGSARFCVGLFLRDQDTGREFLGGVSIFGTTGGNCVAESICGKAHAHRVLVLVRGACCFWTPNNAGSFLLIRTGVEGAHPVLQDCWLHPVRPCSHRWVAPSTGSRLTKILCRSSVFVQSIRFVQFPPLRHESPAIERDFLLYSASRFVQKKGRRGSTEGKNPEYTENPPKSYL